MKLLNLLPVLLLSMAILSGCGIEYSTEVDVQYSTEDDVQYFPAGPEANLAEESVTEVELTAASNEQLTEIVKQHRGKIVIVDFWATWCHTCMELMPHTAELVAEHGDDVVLITMCLDDAEKAPIAKKFLSRIGSEPTHLISSVGGGPKSLDEYALDYGPPHYFFYDRQGELVAVLDSDQEHLAAEESIEATLTELLASE